MSQIWVLLELVALAGLLLLVCAGILMRERDSRPCDPEDESDEPEWWSDFERQFAEYVAKLEAARGTESAAQPPARRHRRSN